MADIRRGGHRHSSVRYRLFPKRQALPFLSEPDHTVKRCQLIGLILVFLLALPVSKLQAQGDGPRVHLPAPTGINPVSLTWMNLDSNMNFAGTILIPDGGIDASVWALNYNRFFAVGDRLAEVWVTGMGGSLDGFININDRRTLTISSSGLSDPYVAMKIGLMGAPARDPTDFTPTDYGFSLYALAGLTLPWGDYDSKEALNLGTNRWSLRLGLPMSFAFGDRGATWLELHPDVHIFGDNDDPFRANRRSQDELYVLESHLSQNFTPKLWASLDLRYQYGGETTTDGVSDENRMDQWGGGATVGYTFSRAWSCFLGYGKIFAGNDNSNGDMWRTRLIFIF